MYEYPQLLHVRWFNPPQEDSYTKYENRLKQEFRKTCIYCRDTSGVTVPDKMEIEHFKPKSKFPEHKNNYENLFTCCHRCNNKKRSFWPSDRQRSIGMHFINPCDHVMSEHMVFDGPTIKGITRTGEWIVERLDLNTSDKLKFREAITASINLLEHFKNL